jgi:tRNA G18 (ribose-2'-O)-methylase SpoU
MAIIAIDDPCDSRLADYRDIRERDLVGRRKQFVAEGKVVVRLLLATPAFEACSVLLLESRLAGMASVLETAPAELPVYVADAATLDAVAGFHVHRGVLAIGRRREPRIVQELLDGTPPPRLVVVAVGIANHDNIGAIFRNAAAFGADAVILDPLSCDPLYRKAIRVSVGGVFKVPFATAASLDDLVSILSARGFAQYGLSPRGAVEIGGLAPGERAAIYLGTEGDGLPQELLARLTGVRIDMAPGFDSLNVAAASAIALHRLWPGPPGIRNGRAAP